jgi:superfamily I DNA/RNA helicase
MTDEQQDAVIWTSQSTGNLILEAVAGSGKTFTIIEMLIAINHHFPSARSALMSFNAKVRDELKSRVLTKSIRNTEVNTVHGFGFSAFKSHFGARKPNAYKLTDLLEPLLKQFKLNYSFSKPITQTVSIAKDTGMDLFYPNTTAEWRKLIDYHDISWDEEKLPLSNFINLCADLFSLSVKNTDKIDFGDMIYLPLKHNLTFPQFDFVFIDEAQDTNATRREVAKRMLKQSHLIMQSLDDSALPDYWTDKGRLIAVGDRHQAIYGFTGADNDALDILKKEFQAAELPLSTCFRCSKSVIRHAQSIVPHIQPRTGAIEGTVNLSMPEYNFHENLFSQRFPDLSHSAILCRKNAPLISLAFQLLEKQIPCRIEGRDIGQELIKLCKKLDNTDSKQYLAGSLRTHLAQQAQKLSPYKYDLLSDKVSAITAVLQLPFVKSVADLYKHIESLFSDYDPSKPSKLTLSSIHKSKGLEWNTVYLLGRNAWMPSKFATQPWMEEQEQNLIYVAITRAKETLYEITVEE